MVFFTCNHCGESLKKPAVEKHYTWKACKNAPPFLTCVDCLKDFRGDEFRAHTKCITEDEKYSAKGFVAKPDKNKGAQKQEAWTEIIQNHLLERKDLDTHTRQTLERIANQSNVPRKKPKFLNFIRSSMQISPNSAERIWQVIETALAEFTKKADAAKAEAAAKRKIADDERIAAKKAAAETQALETDATAVPEKKSKKEKKSAKPKNDGETEVTSKKDKKTKKSKTEPENQVTSTTDKVTEPATQTNGTNGESKKKGGKKRKLDAVSNGVAAVDAVATNGATKKAKLDGEVGGFEWKKEITAVLKTKNKIKVDKLRTNVLKRLAKATGVDQTSDKDEKKFAKHLQKLSKYVSVEGDTATLLSATE